MHIPDSGNSTREELLALVRAQDRIWGRIGGARRHDGWFVYLAELTSGVGPPGWVQQQWAYPEALFWSGVETGDIVAGWLESGIVAMREHDLSLPQLSQQVSWNREQSCVPTQFQPVDWPMSYTELARPENRGEPSGPLLSDSDAPSFARFYNAAAAFFSLGEVRGGALPQIVMFRHQDTSGRIASVRIADGLVAVAVQGSSLTGMKVELASDLAEQLGRSVDGDATIEFPIGRELPAGAWVVLRRGSAWIDRRYLARAWRSGGEPGVEFVESRTRLEVLLAEREGPTVEFKREVPKSADATGVMKSVCAFANGEGGSVLFGVGDDYEVIGVATTEISGLKDQLAQLVHSWVQPTPTISFHELGIDLPGKCILELRVAAGHRLYGSKTSPTSTDFVPHIRHHATSVRARPNEIEQIVRARTPAPGPLDRLGIR